LSQAAEVVEVVVVVVVVAAAVVMGERSKVALVWDDRVRVTRFRTTLG
jgi:hypothetical protein